jgi:hypothetical protein
MKYYSTYCDSDRPCNATYLPTSILLCIRVVHTHPLSHLFSTLFASFLRPFLRPFSCLAEPSLSTCQSCGILWQCTNTFNSYVTRHSPRNLRKISYVSQVTEGIFECAQTVKKWPKNAFFAARRVQVLKVMRQLKLDQLGHGKAAGGGESFSGPFVILRMSGSPLTPEVTEYWVARH